MSQGHVESDPSIYYPLCEVQLVRLTADARSGYC